MGLQRVGHSRLTLHPVSLSGAGSRALAARSPDEKTEAVRAQVLARSKSQVCRPVASGVSRPGLGVGARGWLRIPGGQAAQRVSLAFGLRTRGLRVPGVGSSCLLCRLGEHKAKGEWVISTNTWVFWLVPQQGQPRPVWTRCADQPQRPRVIPCPASNRTPEPRP